MITVHFVEADGTRHEVKIPDGVSVMRGAVEAGITGIVAECGGNAMCATCHVYIDDDGGRRVPPLDDVEDAMLDETAAPRTPSSRLSCQIVAGPEIEGITVCLPPVQL